MQFSSNNNFFQNFIYNIERSRICLNIHFFQEMTVCIYNRRGNNFRDNFLPIRDYKNTYSISNIFLTLSVEFLLSFPEKNIFGIQSKIYKGKFSKNPTKFSP